MLPQLIDSFNLEICGYIDFENFIRPFKGHLFFLKIELAGLWLVDVNYYGTWWHTSHFPSILFCWKRQAAWFLWKARLRTILAFEIKNKIWHHSFKSYIFWIAVTHYFTGSHGIDFGGISHVKERVIAVQKL